MRGAISIAFATALLVCQAGPALAVTPDAYDSDGSDAGELQPYLQCVPYAREVSGIEIHGDAWTWWDQAEGRYARGHTPRVGAVMAFEPYGNMTLGHVAAVSRVVDSRTVLLRHANWSPIDGRRGQIEDNVEAVDVSPDNDWSQVRVWYAPTRGLGSTAWPVAGFIYPNKLPGAVIEVASTDRAAAVTPSRAFLKAFASFEASAPARQPLAATETARHRKPVDLIAQLARN